jgi:ABC-type Co2+ transport system permease subunit
VLSLLPWIWIIPANQYFWDDWAIAANLGLQDQIKYWGSAAKHFGNPVIYFFLLPIGPWIFHTLIIVASILGALSLSRIASQIPIANQLCVQWCGPLFLVMPVFHARFSIATLEYSLALAALLSAWALLVNRNTLLTKISAVTLLIYAIGVPSLAIVFPFIWIHVTWLNISSKNLRDSIAVGIRGLYVLAIPALFSIWFMRLINTE